MDPTKPSLSSKAPHVNNGGGNDSLMEEASDPWRDGVDGERLRDVEARETDVVDGTTAAADITHHHKGSADKHKFSTLGLQRWTKQKVVTDFAIVNKGQSAGAKPKAALRQVLFNQGVSEKNPASEERGQLEVLKQVLWSFPVPGDLKWRWKEESQGSMLEKNWTDIVHSHSTMSKVQRHQQEALWEFVHTELTYINKLIIIKDVVVGALFNLQQNRFLLEVRPEQLFSNLPSILIAHQLFWQDMIYPMLEEVRRTGKPFDPMMLEAGCLQFHERFSTYQRYCWEEENNLEFTRRQMESNPHFFTYVQWVETHPQCDRMRLGGMQAQPHQRITKYPLLLKAVLKTTEDPHVQHSLRGMLSSVNSFLESINDYLKLKDEELALTISAQRVEGYEVERINEDIDRHVREICQFDLTCPIRGVGSGVVRKLLLEGNLKIRGRKDSKLEVVALLFSDVLLMTKVQKKGERLKVVRPPLAIDRTCCMALKDGCSFVLVEVGELRSAMNVYIFATSTIVSCSTWVSTIHQAKVGMKSNLEGIQTYCTTINGITAFVTEETLEEYVMLETLWNLRQTESNRQLENWKIQQLEAKPVPEAKTDDMETEEQHQSRRGTFVDELTEELVIPRSINGMMASKETEDQHQPPDGVATDNPVLSFWHSQPNVSNVNNNVRKQVPKTFSGRQQAHVKGHEWIEMGVRGEQVGNYTEGEEKRGQKGIWNQRVQSTPNLDHFRHSNAADPLRYNTTRPHAFFYPDVDYPTDEDSTEHLHNQAATSREGPESLRLPEEGGISTQRDSDSQSVNLDSSFDSQSGDMETSPEAWSSSKVLRSPGLRKRRPSITHQAPSSHTSGQFFQGSEQTNSYSFSNSNNSLKRNYLPTSSDSHRVLKLGSLKPNQGMFWNMHDRASPDPQTLSEPELPDIDFENRVKTQRSASIPNIVIEGDHELRLHSSTLYAQNPNVHPSPLDGLLERVKEREGLKKDRNVKMANLKSKYPPSPSFSTTPSPSPSPSDGDRDTEWEEVELMRHRARTVSKGWKEQLVDGDEDDKKNSVVFSDGVNVDWSGWCFDDDEVMDHLYPAGEGFIEGISRSLASWDIHGLSEQEDGEYSQV